MDVPWAELAHKNLDSIYENAWGNIHKQLLPIFGHSQPTYLQVHTLSYSYCPTFWPPLFQNLKNPKIDLHLWMFPELNWCINIKMQLQNSFGPLVNSYDLPDLT